ncbi:hypothetical protein NliqN6_2974 [Naganishia liquefaciens]|uniref:N(6)-L-threonylcarbamoyladenine synthase n=1 Tax=Naganishia liquefaciens TaxID=104408 RepID=A0A8H3TSX3_9TREE|nr:hypothetical protein NliqN6_2974 [Naganishia liquefaciens]
MAALRRLPSLTRPFRLLAIESSADDSCASIVTSDRRILSNVVVKQHLIHEKLGGIHPIKAQDAHARNIPLAIRTALQEANLLAADIDAYAFTQGPGMYGCLSCGSHAANAMAGMMDKPIVGVHHMQAHALTPLLTESEPPQFPFLNLLVSGGHTLLVLATGETQFKILAKSLDDSIGDAFDKTAKTLQIPWLPGLGPGPSLEAYALPHPTDENITSATDRYLAEIPKFKVAVPRQMAFSFAGLKTQVLKATTKFFPNLQLKKGMPEGLKRAVARRFQEAAITQLEQKVRMGLDYLENGEGKALVQGQPIRAVIASGGVASNQYLRQRLAATLKQRNPDSPKRLVYPPVALCTDNAAMIAWAGILKLRRQNGVSDPFGPLLRPKWSLEALEEQRPQESEPMPPPEVSIVKD